MRFFSKIISVIIVLAIAPSVLLRGNIDNVKYKKYQQQRMEELNLYYSDYTPVNENDFCTFDLDEELKNGIKFNEVSYIGTHNSYQLKCSFPYATAYRNVANVIENDLLNKDVVDFESESITTQLDLGIRSLEIDIFTKVSGKRTQFIVCHDIFTDVPTTCYDFEQALNEIKMWSDNNPNHLPITVLLEPKNPLIEIGGMKDYTIDYAQETDELLRSVLGDKLLTPKDLLGSYSSFKQMRENDGWPLLNDCMGKVMFVLHLADVTNDYLAMDYSMKSQAMIPGLVTSYCDADYCGYIIVNDSVLLNKNKDSLIKDKKFLIRTRADKFGQSIPAETQAALEAAPNTISTDYPVHSYSTDSDYVVSFENRKTVSYCNRQTTSTAKNKHRRPGGVRLDSF